MNFQTATILVALIVFSGSAPHLDAQDVRLLDGPTVLHANIRDQWGGQTYGYLLQGKRGLFWSARPHDKEKGSPTFLIGQHPTPGSTLPSAVTRIRLEDDKLKACNQPQMIRTPDGYLHVFVGVTKKENQKNYAPGKIRYYRSDKPENITTLVNRSSLIPTKPYGDFHLRMNVGIGPQGKRMALVILAISDDGSVRFNTPVIFIGERKGADFVFRKPVSYAEPMSLFYPQIAVTEKGIIVVGQIWDHAERLKTRLLHLDWDGKLVHRQDLPAEADGQYFSLDLRPDPADSDRLIVYYNKLPKDRKDCRHEFWGYTVSGRKLRLLASLKTEHSWANTGKWFPGTKNYSVFVNNPSMGRLAIWEGDILGGATVTRKYLPGADPVGRGYQASYYLFVPNPLQGSVITPLELFVASNWFNPGWDAKASGPGSLLLWRFKIAP